MASQDALLAYLIVVGLCSKTLCACVGAVGCICRLTQVVVGVVALCPEQYMRWYLKLMHTLFQFVPVFHSRGCLFARGLQILLQPLFWFGNRLSLSMGQFRGVCNRHARTSKTFPYLQKLLPLSHRRCLCPQLGNHFCTQCEVKMEALPGTLTRNWEFGIYER